MVDWAVAKARMDFGGNIESAKHWTRSAAYFQDYCDFDLAPCPEQFQVILTAMQGQAW